MTRPSHNNFPQMPQKRMVVLGNALALPVPELLSPHIIRSKAAELYLLDAPDSTASSLSKLYEVLTDQSYRVNASYRGFADNLEPYWADQFFYPSVEKSEKNRTEFAVYSRMIERWPDISKIESQEFLLLIMEIHRRLGTGVNGFRTTSVGMKPDARGNGILFPCHRLCEPLLRSLHMFLCNHSSQYPVAAATVAYGAMIHAHPFNDGNGRTARALFNLILSSSTGSRHFIPIHLIATARQGSFLIKLRRAFYGDDWGPLQDFFSDAIRLSRDIQENSLSAIR